MTEWENFKDAGFASFFSPLIAGLLSNLVQDPNFSLTPYFFIWFLCGIVTYAVSLYKLFEMKPGFVKNIWNLAGIAVAGFVLVYWAKYYSGLLSIIVELSLIFVIFVILKTFILPKVEKKYDKRIQTLFIVAIILSALFSGLAILPINKPVLVVSPSPDVIELRPFYNETANATITVNINSTLGDSHNVRLYAESDDENNLTAYINGIKKGPEEIPYLKQNGGESETLLILASPEIQEGTHYIFLNYTYQDYLGRNNNGSSRVKVGIHYPGPMSGTTPGFDIVTDIVTSMLLVLILALGKRLKSAK